MTKTGPITEHYERLLARRYVWMLGGAEAQLKRSAEWVDRLGLAPRASGRAVDLGGGPGFFAVTLSQRGFTVDLVDTSSHLLEQARTLAAELPVHTHTMDLRRFFADSPAHFELCACLGDTLTHLPSQEDVLALFHTVYAAMETGGTFLISYRDLSTPLEGTARVIPIRAEDDRIFLCVLEWAGDHVQVHDLVYERTQSGWDLHTSAYPKLILAREWVLHSLAGLGFRVDCHLGAGGMLEIVAQK